MDGMFRKLAKMMEGAKNRRPLESVYSDLKIMTSNYNFIYILAYLIDSDMRGNLAKLYDTDIYEKVSIKEFLFIAGLWLKYSKRGVQSTPNNDVIAEEIANARKLLDEMHASVFIDPLKMIELPEKDLYSCPEVFRESFFYASEPAYESQYLSFAPLKYKHDQDWLLDKREIDIEKADMFYWRVNAIARKKTIALRQIASPTPEDVVNSCCITIEEIKSYFKGFESFFENLSIEYGSDENNNLNDIGDFNVLLEKPIIRLNDSRYFITIPYAISEAIYTSPFYWMMKDDGYREDAAHNRGEVAEEITYDLLTKTFAANSLFKNVVISRAKGKTITDIDILVIFNASAVVFQVKAKALTELSRKGDINAIKSDYSKAIRNAYDQGMTSKECLLNSDHYGFSLKDEELQRVKTIKNVYVVTILLEGYPGVIHQGRIFFDLDKENPPISWSIFDLDLHVKYLSNPDIFMDYIQKRERYAKLMMAENESVLLTRYLETGFNEPDKEMFIYDGTLAQKLDKAYHGESTMQTLKKVGRNELCPCGSGLKYKKCHGAN